MCSAAILRLIIAAVSLGYAAYFYRSMQAAGDSLSFPRIEFFYDGSREIIYLFHVPGVRSSRSERIGEGMFARDGRSSDSIKTRIFQYIAKFYQRIVEIPVAKGHHRYGGRSVTSYRRKIFQQHVGYSSRISRSSKYREIGTGFFDFDF